MKRLGPIFLRWLLPPLLLAVLTTLTWQHRFERRGPSLLPPLAAGLPGWTLESGTAEYSGGTVTLHAGRPAPMVTYPVGRLAGARFLHVSARARWTDIRQAGAVAWATGRIVVCGRQDDGFVVYPFDHAIFSARGSRDWHREEAVFDLGENLGVIEVSLQHFGESGTLELRDLEATVVSQRAWYLPAMAFAAAGWVAWLAGLIARGLLPAALRWRSARALAGGLIVAAAWAVMVFPQPRFSARPLGGAFQLGPSLPPPAAPAPAPAVPPPVAPPAAAPPPEETEIPPPAPAAAPSPAPADAPGPAAPPSPPAPPPVVEHRQTHPIETALRQLDDAHFNLSHVLAFGAFGLALFLCSSRRAWPLAAGVAFASEALPNWQLEQAWDAGDLGDLAADATGLLLAAAFLALAGRLLARRALRPAPVAADPADGEAG